MGALRVCTYNVHKCRGLDGRVRPGRVAEVLREIGADVYALQEVLSLPDASPEEDQGRFIAETLGLSWALGENRCIGSARYGNVVLSRHPLRVVRNHDLTVRGRERRGCLHTDVEAHGHTVHVFNVHLGTGFVERRHQGRRLVDLEILSSRDLSGLRILLGDFNEWTPGLASRLVAAHLESVDVRTYIRRARTFPSVFPLLHLDHIYYEDRMKLERLAIHRSRLAVAASDHLPLVADFRVPPKAAVETADDAEAALAEASADQREP